MTVRVGIDADATATISAINRIADAIRRAGQEGKAFKDMDLSHPELGKLAPDLQQIEKQLQDLARLGKGPTAAGVRNILGGNNASLADLDKFLGADKIYPDQADRDRVIGRAGQYVLSGTQFAPQPPPVPAPPAPPAPPKPPKDEDDMAGMMMRGAKGAAGWMLAMAGVEGVKRMASTAYSGAREEADSSDRLLRHMRDLGLTYEELRDTVSANASANRITIAQQHAFSASWQALTNDAKLEHQQRGVAVAVGMARGYGMDMGTTVNAVARASALGIDPEKFATIVGMSAARGAHESGATMEQTMQAVLRWSESATRLLMNDGQTADFAALYKQMNTSGVPGLRAENGESLITSANSVFRQGGAMGEQTRAYIYRALANAGIRDPYEAHLIAGRGLLEQVGDTDVLGVMQGQLARDYSGTDKLTRERKRAAEMALTGLSEDQADALFSMDPKQRAALREGMKDAGTKLENISPTAMNEILQVLNKDGGESGLEKYRDKFVKEHPDIAKQIPGIATATGIDLRKLMVRGIAAAGMTETTGSRASEAEADFANALTKVGEPLVNEISLLRGNVAELTGPVGDIARAMSDASVDEHGQPDSFLGRIMRSGNQFGKWAHDRVFGPAAPGPQEPNATATGWKNNNPTNLAYVPGQPYVTGAHGRWGAYNTPEEGLGAGLHQMLLDQDRGYNTIRKEMMRRAPPSENDTAGIIARMSRMLHLDPDTPFDLRDPKFAAAFLRAETVGGESNPVPPDDMLAKGVRLGYKATTGGGVALPPRDPAMTGNAARVHVAVTAAPLVVQHQNADGSVRAEEQHPMTAVPRPMPNGAPVDTSNWQ